MHAVDHVFVLLLLVAQPIYGAISYRRYVARIAAGEPADRIRHVVQSAFDGRRIVIFSGGAKGEDQKIFDEARAIRDGGGFGSIIGRNSFQRQKPEALAFLSTVMKIYSGELP